MADAHRLLEALRPYTGDAAHHLDLAQVLPLGALEDEVGRVDLPAPGGGDRVGAVAPAEDTFVGAGEGRGCLHAEVRGDAVEGVLVAGAAAAEGGFGPPADLDAGVGADDAIALFCEGSMSGRGYRNHLLEGGGFDGR